MTDFYSIDYCNFPCGKVIKKNSDLRLSIKWVGCIRVLTFSKQEYLILVEKIKLAY